MKDFEPGDRIRIKLDGYYQQDFTLEIFRYALGFFESEEHRKMGRFTPLCDLYEPGPYSTNEYMANLGPYYTNMVPMFMSIPQVKS